MIPKRRESACCGVKRNLKSLPRAGRELIVCPNAAGMDVKTQNPQGVRQIKSRGKIQVSLRNCRRRSGRELNRLLCILSALNKCSVCRSDHCYIVVIPVVQSRCSVERKAVQNRLRNRWCDKPHTRRFGFYSPLRDHCVTPHRSRSACSTALVTVPLRIFTSSPPDFQVRLETTPGHADCTPRIAPRSYP